MIPSHPPDRAAEIGCPAAEIGCPVAELETPALLVDLDAFEENLARMAAYASGAGIRLRPHAKTHRCSSIARLQVAAGAVGPCVQTVGEAEVLAGAGLADILLTNQVVSPGKLDRLAALARSGRVALCFDSADAVRLASAASVRAGTELGGLVEIDVGQGRCGVPPGEPARDLARRIADAPGLRFDGLQAYHGRAQHLPAFAERREAVGGAVRHVRDTLAALAAEGLTAAIVGGAGTGTFPLEAASGVYTELQPGSYLFMDGEYAGIRDAEDRPYAPFRHALFVLSSVVSTAGRDRAVLDAGLKSISGERGLPVLHGRPELTPRGMSDEHLAVDIPAGAAPLRLGERLLLVPGHCDPTVNLHERYLCVRGGRVEAIWPIDARGRSR